MTIYLIQYSYKADSYNGWYWETTLEEERGFFTDKAKAEAAINALNEDDQRSAYERYAIPAKAAHNTAKSQAKLLSIQNEALAEKGLPLLPGDTSAQFSTFEPIPFEEWIEKRYNLEHYYELLEIEEAHE